MQSKTKFNPLALSLVAIFLLVTLFTPVAHAGEHVDNYDDVQHYVLSDEVYAQMELLRELVAFSWGTEEGYNIMSDYAAAISIPRITGIAPPEGDRDYFWIWLDGRATAEQQEFILNYAGIPREKVAFRRGSSEFIGPEVFCASRIFLDEYLEDAFFLDPLADADIMAPDFLDADSAYSIGARIRGEYFPYPG